MPRTLTYSDTLSILECGECRISFAIPQDLHTKLRQTGKLFWCPNGHQIGYEETENKRLKEAAEQAERRLASTRAQLDQVRADRDHQEARVHGYQGALAKTKKRAAKGVCPAPGCKRHFADVERHIASKHPDWSSTD
jgi:hypothetical protein